MVISSTTNWWYRCEIGTNQHLMNKSLKGFVNKQPVSFQFYTEQETLKKNKKKKAAYSLWGFESFLIPYLIYSWMLFVSHIRHKSWGDPQKNGLSGDVTLTKISSIHNSDSSLKAQHVACFKSTWSPSVVLNHRPSDITVRPVCTSLKLYLCNTQDSIINDALFWLMYSHNRIMWSLFKLKQTALLKCWCWQ